LTDPSRRKTGYPVARTCNEMHASTALDESGREPERPALEAAIMHDTQSEANGRTAPSLRDLRMARTRRLRAIKGPSASVVFAVFVPPSDKDAFCRSAYNQDDTPRDLIQRFIDAYLNGELIPPISGTIEAPTVSINAYIPRQLRDRLYARVRSTGASASAVLRCFVVAYLRGDISADGRAVQKPSGAESAS
jgi:hypothetical protein